MKRIIAFSCCLPFISGFYLPGAPPKVYKEGDEIMIKANSLSSSQTQLSFDYYSLPFCQSDQGIVKDKETLGERLSGVTIDNTPYQINMLQDKKCELLCKKTYSRKELDQFISKIQNDYNVNLMMDNLPAAKKLLLFHSEEQANKIEHELQDLSLNMTTKQHIASEQEYMYDKGYPLGRIIPARTSDTWNYFDDHYDYTFTKGDIALNNHINIIVLHNDKGNIVGFEVEEDSINHEIIKIPNTDTDETDKWNEDISCDYTHGDMIIDGPKGFNKINSMDIIWSYSVKFQKSDILWATRWDAYLKMTNPQVHWFQIFNSFIIVILLSASVAIILTRTLRKDLLEFKNSLENDVEKQRLINGHKMDKDTIMVDELNDHGWKIVHGDVFRPPKHSYFFIILISSGFQTFLMALLSILFSALGFASPAIRGSLLNACIFFFAVSGYANGYYSARLYKLFGGDDKSFNSHIFKTAVFYPAFNFIAFILIDVVIWVDTEATNAVPFGTLLALIGIFCTLSFPMVYFGGYNGYKRKTIEVPCKVRRIPRVVPEKPWYLKRNFALLTGGLIVFGSVFVEMIYIMSSVWNHHYYYVFGFLLLIFIMLVIISAQVSILLVYSRLVYEDYNWWYCSFFTPATSGIVAFVYSIYYFNTSLQIAPLLSSYCMYFGYMALISVALGLITGFAGFYGTFWFVKTIYGAIKSD